MSSNGFGFSFSFGGDDDDKSNRNNPFGGGLGDMLNQFGQMLSGMGSSMNSPDAAGPVNYTMAERIARQQIAQATTLSEQDRKAVTEAVQLVELWLDSATILPASGNKVEAWNETQWLEASLPAWKRLVTPVAEHLNRANMESIPEEARDMMGPMSQMMDQFTSMNHGMQLGHALGELARQTLAGSDFGINLAPEGVTAILPSNVREATRQLNVESRETMVYAAALEAARARLFRHVHWLRERLIASVEEYAQGLEIDTSHIEETLRELNLESGDPQAIQEAMERLQGTDMTAKVVTHNTAAGARLETLLALIEGWAELVVMEALQDRIPATSALQQAWQRRRDTGGSAEQAFSSIVGIEINPPKVTAAKELWRRVGVAVGMERRDQIWEHPDLLPGAEDLEQSAEFIDGLLDSASGSDDFDPIAEINALEAMLAEQDTPRPTSAEDESGGSGEDGEDPKN